jgi:hypothetical protein
MEFATHLAPQTRAVRRAIQGKRESSWFETCTGIGLSSQVLLTRFFAAQQHLRVLRNALRYIRLLAA